MKRFISLVILTSSIFASLSFAHSIQFKENKSADFSELHYFCDTARFLRDVGQKEVQPAQDIPANYCIQCTVEGAGNECFMGMTMKSYEKGDVYSLESQEVVWEDDLGWNVTQFNFESNIHFPGKVTMRCTHSGKLNLIQLQILAKQPNPGEFQSIKID